MNACVDREQAVWDDILNETYRRLRDKLDDDAAASSCATCSAPGSPRATRPARFYWDFYQGTMASPMASDCVNRETARRALFLLGFLNDDEGGSSHAIGRSQGLRHSDRRPRHLDAARARLRAAGRAGDPARLPPHRHRADVRQRARGGRGRARLRHARDEVMVTTKVRPTSLRAARRSSARSRRACAQLRLDEIDLLADPLAEPARAARRDARRHGQAEAGRARARTSACRISPWRCSTRRARLSTEPLVCNQIEMHPFLDQSKVIAACRAHGMAVVAYSPIARGSAPERRGARAHRQGARQDARRRCRCAGWCSRASS